MFDCPRDWRPLQRAAFKYRECMREGWANDLYHVAVERLDTGFVHLAIRRRDGRAKHDWRHLQQIKNEVVGAECEAVELFPAESRKWDTSNTFHLFVWPDPT